jgi:hypothetical protein
MEDELYPESYPIKQILEKYNAGGKEKSVIVFTGGFENDTVKIVNGEEVIFEEPVNTNVQTGFATFWVTSNEKKIEIQIFADKFAKISLKEVSLKKYKFVYISRDSWGKRKYTIEYSNEWKRFQ